MNVADLKATPSRSLNGRETAHDHLWLTQDLWAKPEVVNWVDGDVFVKQHVLRVCSEPGCGKVEETVKQWQQCSGCKKVRIQSSSLQFNEEIDPYLSK